MSSISLSAFYKLLQEVVNIINTCFANKKVFVQRRSAILVYIIVGLSSTFILPLFLAQKEVLDFGDLVIIFFVPTFID